MLWIKTAFDAGTPFALIGHTDFSKWQELYVKKTLWSDEQFERRLNRKLMLPAQHSKDDMIKIARAHFPEGDERSWKLLAGCALASAKKQASGVVEALHCARYRANQSGRDVPSFDDVRAAVIIDQLGGSEETIETDAEALQRPCKDFARAVQSSHKKARAQTVNAGQFRISGRQVMPAAIGS
jgi:hypothetical protein